MHSYLLRLTPANGIYKQPNGPLFPENWRLAFPLLFVTA